MNQIVFLLNNTPYHYVSASFIVVETPMGTVSPSFRGKTVGAGAERTRGGDPWVALVPVSPAGMENHSGTGIGGGVTVSLPCSSSKTLFSISCVNRSWRKRGILT